MVFDRSGNGHLLGGRAAVLAIRVVPELDISDLAGEGATVSPVRKVFDEIGQVVNIALELVLDSDARCSDNDEFADADLSALLESKVRGIVLSDHGFACHGFPDRHFEIISGPSFRLHRGCSSTKAC